MLILHDGLDKTTRLFIDSFGIQLMLIEEIESIQDVADWTQSTFGAEVLILNIDDPRIGLFAPRFLRSEGVGLKIIGYTKNQEYLSAWSETRASFLENGGDDFLRAPLNPRELSATISAVSRRTSGRMLDVISHVGVIDEQEVILKINLGISRVTVDDLLVHLTQKEFGMLRILAERSGAIVTKEQFLNGLYDPLEEEPEIKIIDVFICKLRKKLGSAGVLIETVWGKGYMLIGKSSRSSKSSVA